MQLEKYIFTAFIKIVISERNIKMQVNSVNSMTFGAKIIPSEYLNKAIDLAKKDAKSLNDMDRHRARKFYNNLRTIELDCTRTQLVIDKNNNSTLPVLILDNDRSYIPVYKNVEGGIGAIVQNAINTLAKRTYFASDIKHHVFMNENSFDAWVK